MKFWVFKSGSKLVPCTSEDKESVAKLPAGEPFMISYVKVRNPKHHRLYFGFLNVVYQNLPEKFESNWPDFDSFRKAMQMYAGYYTETITLKGERRLEAKSIKYEELDEMEFSELHTRIKNFIGKHILPEMDIDIVEKSIEQFY